jgi:hypothetical protein
LWEEKGEKKKKLMQTLDWTWQNNVSLLLLLLLISFVLSISNDSRKNKIKIVYKLETRKTHPNRRVSHRGSPLNKRFKKQVTKEEEEIHTDKTGTNFQN